MAHPDMTMLSSLLKEGMSAGQMPFLRVTSGSMAPLLRAGDEVGVQSISLEQLQCGDLVVVSDDEQLLTHRFYGMQGSATTVTFLTRGDRVPHFDKLWTANQLLGRVIARRREKSMLWLDYGPGHWLNNGLARLSRVEGSLLKLHPSQPAPADSSSGRRLIRASMRLLAGTMTIAVERFAGGSLNHRG